MKQKNLTKSNIELASKFLRIEEGKEADKKRKKLEESGTPTTALPPSTNATRQMAADVAAAENKKGVGLAGPNAEPKPDHGETAMGTQDPMGADKPVDTPAYAEKGQNDGMVVPADQRGTPEPQNAGPSSDTQEMNATSGIKRAKPTSEELEKLTPEKMIEAYVNYCGGVEEAIFRLLAEGISLVEAEAVIADKKIEEGLIDKVKSALHSSLGERKPSAGYVQHLRSRQERRSSGRPDFSANNSSNRDKPWSATRKEGADARRNR